MKLTAERLVKAIFNQIDGYESSDALKILRDDYGFSDDEIRDMGLDYLFDCEESNETDEPLKEYTFLYTESMSGTFTVKAHSEDEAWERVESIEFCSADLNFNDDGEFTLIDTH